MARRRSPGEGLSGRIGTVSRAARREPQVVRPGPAAGAGAPAAGTIIGRRTARPGPRAVLGGFLVAAAAVVVFSVALSTAQHGQASYVVAARALPAGSVIGPGDTATVRLGLAGTTRDEAFRDGSVVIGRTLAVPVAAGSLILSPMLTVPGGGGRRPVSIAVGTDSLAGLSAGETVDVLEVVPSSPSAQSPTAGPGGAPAAPVEMVLRGATLLALERQASSLSATGSTAVVTLGVTTLEEAEALIAAAHSGTIELVQATPADGEGLGPGS